MTIMINMNEKEIEESLEEIESIYYNLDDSFGAMKQFKKHLEKLYELKKEYFKLDKALWKACDLLQCLEIEDDEEKSDWLPEEWREWCMKDD